MSSFEGDPNAEMAAEVVSYRINNSKGTEATVHRQNTEKQNRGDVRENTHGDRKRLGTSKE